MAVSTEKYEPMKIERIRRKLEKSAEAGKPEYFEIYVDDLKVVPRTNNLDEFDTFEEFIDGDSGKIVILIYGPSPTTPRNHRYIYLLKGTEASQAQQGLSGAELNTVISQRINQERERWDTELVRKDLTDTKQKLGEAEEYIETLQTELEHYKNKKLHLGDINLGELASVVVEGMIRRNPQMIAKLPGGSALAGIIEQDNKERLENAQNHQPETGASFKKKSADTNISAEDQRYIKVIRQMEEHFDPEEIEMVMRIVNCLVEVPENIIPVAELLNLSIEPNETEEEGKQ